MHQGTLWHWTLGTSAAFFAIGGVAFACDLVPAPEVLRGILGSSFQLGGSGAEIALPKNFAIVDRGPTPTLDDGTVLSFEPTDLTGIARVTTDVAPGSTITTASSEIARVEDVIDTTPPSAVTLAGGSFEVSEGDDGGAFGCGAMSSCGTISRLMIDADAATDDHTASQRITYAIFLGSSQAEVTTSAVPDGFFVRDNGTLWRFADEAEGERDIWVVVAAIDLAGNVGPRSTPMQIHASSSGCRVAPPSSALSTGMFALAIGAGLAWRARRKRR
jgi:hypothetical protein